MTRSMLTVAETAAELRISDDLVYRLCKAGEIPHRRFGRRVLIPRVVVDDLCGLTTAMTSPSHGPAAVVEGEAIGVAGPLGNGACGEVGSNVGPSASGRPATPTTNKRATARTVTLQNNAG